MHPPQKRPHTDDTRTEHDVDSSTDAPKRLRPDVNTTSAPATTTRSLAAWAPRIEFTLEHLEAAARDSARCVSVSLNVARLFRDARVIYLTDDSASWVYYIPKWFRRIYTHCHTNDELPLPYADWFMRVWDKHPKHHDTIKMFGKDVPTPRFQQMFGNVDYRFSGATFVAKPIPPELDLITQLLRACVTSSTTGETYLTSLLVNWFAHGDHYIGPHSDAESQLHTNSPIFSLSLGTSRRFVMTPRKDTAAPNPKTLELLLGDGDLLIMGGTTQKTHKHAVPKMKKAAGKRMSVTMRCYK